MKNKKIKISIKIDKNVMKKSNKLIEYKINIERNLNDGNFIKPINNF